MKLHNAKFVRNTDDKIVIVSRSTELTIIDEFGREKERYKVPYGAILTVDDGAKVDAGGESLLTGIRTVTQSSLSVLLKSAFADVDDSNTEMQQDELTGLTRIVVKDLA